MGNKYGSNIRTYTARNLVWDNSGPAEPIAHVIAAPVALSIEAGEMFPVFYKSQFPTLPSVPDWNRNSKISVKRAGIFCNFADGLVQKMDTSRVEMMITVSIREPVEISIGVSNVHFVAGSNIITGDDLNLLSPVGSKKAIVYDTLNGIPYYVQQEALAPGGNAYLTDYAMDDADLTALYRLDLVNNQTKTFTISNIATLNTMYEAEIFFPYCPASASELMLVSCQLGIDSGASFLDFYTKSIDTSFNGSPVSFDSVIELEITPL